MSTPKNRQSIIGGMVEIVWSGIKMWKCPRCMITTQDQQEAKVHVCAAVRFADEEIQEGE